ncbi:MAG: hypothetical protein JRF71_10260 [Deltaproteobacteria bacterium]|nr:hypothetical protein [Deltaproteobacteria bacterium]MBW2201200.1 hypothetical protein [Deltaproteobacteria bacterium]
MNLVKNTGATQPTLLSACKSESYEKVAEATLKEKIMPFLSEMMKYEESVSVTT